MTLNGRNVTLVEMKKIYGAHQKYLNEDTFISVAKCRPMILVSICGYSRGFLVRGVNCQTAVMVIPCVR